MGLVFDLKVGGVRGFGIVCGSGAPEEALKSHNGLLRSFGQSCALQGNAVLPLGHEAATGECEMIDYDLRRIIPEP